MACLDLGIAIRAQDKAFLCLGSIATREVKRTLNGASRTRFVSSRRSVKAGKRTC